MSTIKVEHLSKHFRHQSVLRDVNLRFTPNRIYGLLGRNGTGKSTLLSIMTDQIFASEGRVTIDGKAIHNQAALLNQIFMMSEANHYPESMRVGTILKVVAQLYPDFDNQLATTLMDQFGVRLKTKFGKLSTGYHSIVKFILALSVPVQFVILDEPTLGLDASHRELLYSALIQSYSEHPRTFIIATHLIDEVANLISGVVILNAGQIVTATENEQLLKEAHTITGPAAELDRYCEGLNVIGSKQLAHLKTNYVYGALNDERRIPDTVKITGLDLQTLFIYLTQPKGDAVHNE